MPDIVERNVDRLTVRIDRATCIANESCMALAPQFFALDNEGICAFRDPPQELGREELIEACRICPVDALSVVDEDGTQLVP